MLYYFLENYCLKSIRKEFNLKDYFLNYSSILSNQDTTKVKQFFIELVKDWQNINLIESKFERLLDNNQENKYEIKNLTTSDLLEGIIIYEKL